MYAGKGHVQVPSGTLESRHGQRAVVRLAQSDRDEIRFGCSHTAISAHLKARKARPHDSALLSRAHRSADQSQGRYEIQDVAESHVENHPLRSSGRARKSCTG
ncbi:hypothetical protein KC324_g67 [Hortaea werneckii]|nr:hypothetical protein KC324_g67 [Hortaea werneckii]